jgi:hypothetical protein
LVLSNKPRTPHGEDFRVGFPDDGQYTQQTSGVNIFLNGPQIMNPTHPNRILWIILGGLLAWGFLLAVGTIVYPGRLAVYRALIIFGCTFVFVAFWGWMLLWRQYNPSNRKQTDSVKFPPPGA